jgi:hypothetical protein
MKSSCYFFNRLGIPTQFSDSNSPISVLHGTNLYSLTSSIYFHLSSLSVSWQRIYNTFTMDTSSNHTISLHRPTSNSSSTTNFPRLFLTANCLELWTASFGIRLSYKHSAQIPQKTQSLLLRHTGYHVMATVVLCMCCIATVHARTRRKHFHSIFAWRMR